MEKKRNIAKMRCNPCVVPLHARSVQLLQQVTSAGSSSSRLQTWGFMQLNGIRPACECRLCASCCNMSDGCWGNDSLPFFSFNITVCCSMCFMLTSHNPFHQDPKSVTEQIKVSELSSFSMLLLQHRATVDFGGWIYYFISKILYLMLRKYKSLINLF